ncbi:MAG TPA: hypothetical protein VNW98_07120 [Burkholderiaceae bacterium]|jgi:hypothetical protein|nr:hypothetical protein [Acetobacteraceae bacterium]HWY73396.1 hypothetical protein [Burkholderiaceae bacterium]
MDTQSTLDAPIVTADRRRPGRIDYENTTLIGLLREPQSDRLEALLREAPAPAIATVDTRRNDLDPARGMLIAILLAVPLWGVIGLLAWFFLRL